MGDGKPHPARWLFHVIEHITAVAAADGEAVADIALRFKAQLPDQRRSDLVAPQRHAVPPADPRDLHRSSRVPVFSKTRQDKSLARL